MIKLVFQCSLESFHWFSVFQLVAIELNQDKVPQQLIWFCNLLNLYCLSPSHVHIKSWLAVRGITALSQAELLLLLKTKQWHPMNLSNPQRSSFGFFGTVIKTWIVSKHLSLVCQQLCKYLRCKCSHENYLMVESEDKLYL